MKLRPNYFALAKYFAAAALACAGCGSATDAPLPDGGDPTAPDLAAPVDFAAPRDLTPAPPATYLLQLDAGAFAPVPSHPSALVYLPTGFDPTQPVGLIVYIHGFDNCVENIVRDAGQPCTPGQPARSAYSLAAQLEASNKNAMLLCPEIDYDQATGAPGNLGLQNGFKALLTETLGDLPQLGLTVDKFAPIVVASHSGGYQAAAGIAQRGGIPVQEIYLLDSLYGNTADYDAWVMSDLPSLVTTARRFATVYTTSGGTLANSQAMADRAATWVNPDAGVIVDDRTTSTWDDATYHHGLLFKHSALAHDGVPVYYFGKLVSSSQLPARP